MLIFFQLKALCMKVFLLFFTVLILITGYSEGNAQEQNKITSQDPAYIDLSQTVGFVEGQHFSLEKIKQEFPDLAPSAQVASLKFNSSFSAAEKAINEELKTLLKGRYTKYISDIRSQIQDGLVSQVLNQEVAANFIAEVSDRATGNIPSPFLETLLTYQYKNNPAEEFARKFIRSFNTKDHSKSKGLEITVSYPASWKPAEGDRPNVVQKFISKNGRGSELFLIMVKDLPLPEGYVITKQELNEFFIESELKQMLPQNSNFISAKSVVLDNHKGGVILFDQTVQRLDMTVTIRVQMYVTIVKDKIVFLQFMLNSKKIPPESLEKRFQQFELLFRMIANSFIIQNQYTEPNYTLQEEASTFTDITDLYSMDNIIISLLITWFIGLLPPVLIRFLIWRKPIKKWPAIGVASTFWFVNFIIFVGVLGSQSKSHFAIFLIACVSYEILKYGHKEPAS